MGKKANWPTQNDINKMDMLDVMDYEQKHGTGCSGCGCLFFLIVMGAASIVPVATIITDVLLS